MSKALVSIIVPMYNAEHTISRCLTSIQQQTYKKFEVIVINDGSTDHSAKVVQKIAHHDERIQLVLQHNQGVSTSRNEGIRHATGMFIQFVDADDWIEPTMTSQLVEAMQKEVDLVICGYQTSKAKVHPHKSGVYNVQEWRAYLGTLYKHTLVQSPCNKMYRRSLIQKAKIEFNLKYSIGEDFLFNLNYLTHTNKLALLTHTPYHYRAEDNSLTRSFNPNLFKIQKSLYHSWEAFLIHNNCNTKANNQAGAAVFIQGTGFSINNLYTQKLPKENNPYQSLKKIVHDPTVAQTAKTTNGLLAFLLRYKQSRLIHILYKIKSMIRR